MAASQTKWITLFTICFLLTYYRSLYQEKLKTMILNQNVVIRKHFVQQPNQSRLCTFGLFRSAYKDFLPSGGEWLKTDNNITHYQPQICKLKYPRVTKTFMTRCLAKANITSVVTLGDSTAGLYFEALRQITLGNCVVTRTEKLKDGGFLPDIEYYKARIPSKVAQYLDISFRYCRGCASRTWRCEYHPDEATLTVDFEHLAQTMILDGHIRLSFPNHSLASTLNNKIWAVTSHEVLFRYYLRDHPPDLLLVFLPFMHVKSTTTLSRLPLEITYHLGLMKEYLPATTKIFYMPTYAEVHDHIAYYYEDYTMGATELIGHMNHVLYDTIKNDLLGTDTHIYGFLDLFHASLSRGNWSLDGIHMKTVWYEAMMSIFWETYCNSVTLEQF